MEFPRRLGRLSLGDPLRGPVALSLVATKPSTRKSVKVDIEASLAIWGHHPQWVKLVGGGAVIFSLKNLHYMDISLNGGTPKPSILIGFSIINHPFWDTPIFGNIHIGFGGMFFFRNQLKSEKKTM